MLKMGKLTLFASFLKCIFLKKNVLPKKDSEALNVLQNSIEENIC